MRRNGDAPFRERGEYLGLRLEGKGSPRGKGDRVAVESQRPRYRYRRIELAQCAGGSVPRIREPRLARLHPRFVHLLETVEWVVDFTPNLDHGRWRGGTQPQRHIAERSDVGGDVLADDTVTACCARDQNAATVRQTHRGAVDFELGRVAAL